VNELLLWMSARRLGSEPAFRSKVAELGLSRSGHALWRTAKWNFEKLAHAEFAPAADGAGWRTAPPVLAAKENEGQFSAILCGARTPALLARLAAAGATCAHIPQQDGPDVVQVSAATACELEDAAAKACIRVQWKAPLAILCCATAPKQVALQPAVLPVGGWTVSQFSKPALEWTATTLRTATEARSGLFRFRSDYETIYILKKEGHAYACDPAVGKYRILRPRNRVLGYAAADNVLSVTATCRPPALIERALVLCSGRLPTFNNGRLNFQQVGRSVAQAAAAVLGQRLHE
jgi:hypothetical protein